MNFIKLNTSFGDELLFKSMLGEETISSIYDFKIEAISKKNTKIDIKKLLGKTINLEIITRNNNKRYLSGDVTKVNCVGMDNVDSDYILYTINISPWLWYLKRNKDCKIYQEMSVVDILDEVLGSYSGFTYEKKLTGSYPTREYCVQYEESDFNFISRLMEHEGIYYYFKHDANKVTVILCDDINSIEKLPNYSSIKFNQFDSAMASDEIIDYWNSSASLEGIEYVVNDYDYKKSAVDLLQKKASKTTIEQANREIYDWQAGYYDINDGEHYVKVRLEEERSLSSRGSGSTNVRGFAPGYIFTLKEALLPSDNKDYLIISAGYDFKIISHANNSGSFLRINFTVQDAEIPYRSKSSTLLPKTQGPQTAVVTGPAGKEIYTDKFQRIKVHFIWDRYNEPDENSSCWIRISNDSAGAGFGALSPPRIGQEVIVDFIGGNPDRPIVTGRVYNDKKMPSDNFNPSPTKSGLVVQSFGKDSTSANASHFLIDADKGNESVSMHAEKDASHTTENDQLNDVGNDHTHKVGNNHSQTIGNDQTIDVKNNQTETIGANQDLTVKGNQSETVKGNQTMTVKGNRSHTVEEGDETISVSSGKRALSVEKDQITTINGNRIVTVAKDVIQSLTGSNHSINYINAGLTTTIHGNNTTTIDGVETQSFTNNKHSNIYDGTGLASVITGIKKSLVTGNQYETLTSSGHIVNYLGGKRETEIKGKEQRKATVEIIDEAGSSFTLKVGGSTIKLLPGSIELSSGGSTIKLEGSGVSIDGKKIDLNA